jgi:hypothetical protein
MFDKKNRLRIHELFAVVAQEPEGERIAAFSSGEYSLPMICANRAHLDSLLELARDIIKNPGKKITLCRFSVREELEVI